MRINAMKLRIGKKIMKKMEEGGKGGIRKKVIKRNKIFMLSPNF
jgi:hypothetical protein